MSSLNDASAQEAGRRFLEKLRPQYEQDGFTFTVSPDKRDLPSFFDTYRPGAVARKPDLNVAIEVKRREMPSAKRSLQHIRQLFEGRPDWRLDVVFAGSDPLQSLLILPAQPEAIRSRMDEVAALSADGHRGVAFVMAWSLLEAALRSLDGETPKKPHAPGTIVQSLAMNGYIAPEMERRLRSLIGLRNRIVHGDLTAEPDASQVALVLAAINDTLETTLLERVSPSPRSSEN